ncbi:hypothetical protein C8R43DRAFT_899179, partial [Mycena crocata]
SQARHYISCEVCMTTMWTPYILGCGHSFCVDCLVDWFGTILCQHITAHPDWRVSNQPPYHLLSPRIRALPYVAALIEQQGPQPKYTCPKCRAAVLANPVEDYTSKAVIHAVGRGIGESQECTKWSHREPFDGFFGWSNT